MPAFFGRKSIIHSPTTEKTKIVAFTIRGIGIIRVFDISEEPHSYSEFDSNGDGEWMKYINIPITTTPSEYAQYKVVIDPDNVTVYSADGTQKAQGVVASDFWANVKSDGSDIRVFNQNKEQRYFWVEEFDYNNKKAVIWVKVEAGDTELNIAYGNANALESVYNSAYKTLESVYPTNKKTVKKRILVASDEHWGDSSDYETNWNNFIQWVQDEINSKGLDAIVFTGDWIQSGSDKTMLQTLYNDLSSLGVPVYPVKGNHDEVTEAEFQEYTGYPTNYVVEDGEYAYVIANTSDESGTYLCADYSWLDTQLSNLTNKKVLIFMHIPQHPWTGYDLDCPDVQSVIASYNNILGVFVGHDHDLFRAYYADNTYWCWHGRIGSTWGTPFLGYAIIEIYDDDSLRYYVVDGSTKEIKYETWLNPELKITKQNYQKDDVYIDTRNNQIYFYKPSGYVAITAVFPNLVTDKAIIEFETIGANDNVGLVFHGADNEVKGYVFWIDYGSSEWKLFRYDSTTKYESLVVTSADVSVPQKVKVIVNGNSVSIYVNDQTFVENYTLDGTYTSGRIGLYIGHSSDASAENYGTYNGYFKVYKLADPADFGTPRIKTF